MTKWTVAALALLLLAGAVAYWTLVYIPQKNELAQKEYCRKLGSEYLQSEEKRFDNSSTMLLGNAQYVYSKKLNTCLYSNSKDFLLSGLSNTEYYIIDLGTNEKLASYHVWSQGCDSCNGSDVAKKQEAEYETIYDENFK